MLDISMMAFIRADSVFAVIPAFILAEIANIYSVPFQSAFAAIGKLENLARIRATFDIEKIIGSAWRYAQTDEEAIVKNVRKFYYRNTGCGRTVSARIKYVKH